MSEEYGIVYALVNEAMPGLVKIGITGRSEISTRVRELSSASGVPLPFTVACACQVRFEKKEQIEAALHQAFAPYRLNPKREFFKISPEQVQGLFDVLDEGEPSEETTRELAAQVDETINAEERNAIEKLQRSRRPPLNFVQMDIPVGSVLTYAHDSNVTVTVASEKKVTYEGEEVSLTSVTTKLLKSEFNVHPTPHWLFNGRNLLDIYEETYPIVEM